MDPGAFRGRIAGVLAGLLLLTGCAGGRALTEGPVGGAGKVPERGLGAEHVYTARGLGERYSEIVILDFSLEGTVVSGPGGGGFNDSVRSLATMVPDVVAGSLRRWGLFDKVERASTIDYPSASAVILRARFTTLASEPGGFLSRGSTTVAVDGELLEASTGRPLADFSHESRFEGGSDFRRAGVKLGRDIARFIRGLRYRMVNPGGG